MEYARLDPGTPLYVGVTFPQPGAGDSLGVRAARAHVVEQSGHVDITAWVCSLRSGRSAVGAGDHAMVTDHCSSLVAAEGATMRPGGEPPQQLVLSVTARGTAKVVIEGVDVEYSQGWRRGTQRVGGALDLSTSDH